MDIVARLIALPCRAEDILYVLDNKCENGIDECKVICLKLFKKQIKIETTRFDGSHRIIHKRDFGRWVFTSKEEAKAIKNKAKSKHQNEQEITCENCKWHWVRLYDGELVCYNEKSKNYNDITNDGCDFKELN